MDLVKNDGKIKRNFENRTKLKRKKRGIRTLKGILKIE